MMVKKITGALFLLIITCSSVTFSQEKSSNQFLQSFGITLGVYDAALDYWKTNPNSVFLGAKYDENYFAHGFLEFGLTGDLAGKVGLGYWQQRAQKAIPKFGTTTMLLTGIPVSVDFIYYIEPIKISIFTPFAGIGGELLFVDYALDFRDKENPDPVSGITTLATAIAGFQSKLSDHFSLDFIAEYKFGSYEQDFVEEIESQDPNVPNSTLITTEEIALDGWKFGFSLKYLF
jgi:hypothetical protein